MSGVALHETHGSLSNNKNQEKLVRLDLKLFIAIAIHLITGGYMDMKFVCYFFHLQIRIS